MRFRTVETPLSFARTPGSSPGKGVSPWRRPDFLQRA